MRYDAASRDPTPVIKGRAEELKEQINERHPSRLDRSAPYARVSLDRVDLPEQELYTEGSSLADFVETFFHTDLDLPSLTVPGLDWDEVSVGSLDDNQERLRDYQGANSLDAQLFIESSDIKNERRKLGILDKTSTGKMWNPVWLGNYVLVGFSVIFLVILIVILSLYLYSEAHKGLLNASESLHYVWTYLPIAIFVLLTSLWHQVDFHCKELTPYHEMRQGPASAAKSMLLDYIDPILPVSFWKALKHRHWAVVTSSTSLVLLKLCIILSPSFLFIVPIEVSRPTDSLIAMSNFNATNLDLTQIAAGPVDAFYGSKVRDLPWTYGTMENLTVQTFNYVGSDASPSALLTAEVDGFTVAMECGPAHISDVTEPETRPWSPGGQSVLTLYLAGNVSGPGCELKRVVLGHGPSSATYRNPNNRTSEFQGLFDYYICNSDFDYWELGSPDTLPPNATSLDDIRFLLTMSKVAFDPGPKDANQIFNITIAQATGVLCKPSYDVDRYKVTLAPFNETILSADLVPNTSTNITGFGLMDLYDGIYNAIAVTNFGQGSDENIITQVGPMFQLLSSLNNHSQQEPLIDQSLLQNLATQALRGVGTQFAHLYLKQNHERPLSGYVTMIEQRLRVKRLPLGLLIATLGLLAIGSLIIIWIRPWDSVPCAPKSLAAATTILAASSTLREYIKPQSSSRIDSFVKSIEKWRYQTIITTEGRFVVRPTLPASGSCVTSPKSEVARQRAWWRPMATRTWFTACLIIAPLILITVLEVLQRSSDRNHGLVELHSNDDYHLAASYGPVLIMLLIAAMYSTLNFTISAFTPFLTLRRGNALAERSISANYISKLPLHAFYLSLRSRHWAVFLTISAAFISSFLTIITSGLYSPHTVSSNSEIQLQQTSFLNLSHVDLVTADNLAGTITKLIVLHNLSYPTWTYKDLVFPTFAAPQMSKSPLGGNSTLNIATISVRVPALRPSLDCIQADPSSVVQSGNFYWSGEMYVMKEGISGFIIPPPGVHTFIEANFSVLLKRQETISWDSSLIMPNDTQTSISNVRLGYASPLMSSTQRIMDTATDKAVAIDIDPSTPSFGIVAGLASGSRTDRIEPLDFLDGEHNVTIWDIQTDTIVAVCYQVLEIVQTNVTFEWPSMRTSEMYPPVPDENTARVILSNETSTPTWAMNISTQPSSPHWFGISLNSFIWALQDTSDTANTLSAWFTTLENGIDGRPLSQLLGGRNVDNLLTASTGLYARYVVQAINANMRSDVGQSGQHLPAYNATLLMPVLRLKQNKAPKIILQVLLSVMTACGISVSFMVDTRKVLRRSPCSIAGKMELLVASELCSSGKVIPAGAEWWHGSQRREQGLFDGWLFRLGWWGETTAWYGIDVESASTED